MPSNVAEFNKQVAAFANDLAPAEAVIFQKRIVLEALERIVLKTPVDTGRARGNWQVTINELPSGEVSVTETGTSGTGFTDTAVLTNLVPYQIVYITNNVPYIVYLEGGSSPQAPQGMVAITINELVAMFE
jgi:hypothetical protein